MANRLLIEICCDKNSRLGQQTEASDGCQVLRITEEDDFTTQECVEKIKNAIQCWGDTKSILVWSSIPCTGGSTWQYVNEAVYTRSNNELALRRLRNLRSVFEKLWINFELIAEDVISGGGSIVIEWPAMCTYWKHPRVEHFVQRHGIGKTRIDGCAYGMRGVCGGYVKKPWILASNSGAVG